MLTWIHRLKKPEQSWALKKKLNIDNPLIQPNRIMVRVIDGNKTNTLGEVELRILFTSGEFNIPFVVIDIPSMFNILLGPFMDPIYY